MLELFFLLTVPLPTWQTSVSESDAVRVRSAVGAAKGLTVIPGPLYLVALVQRPQTGRPAPLPPIAKLEVVIPTSLAMTQARGAGETP